MTQSTTTPEDSAKAALELYATAVAKLKAEQDALDEAVRGVIPEEVQTAVDAVKAERAPQIASLTAHVEQLADVVKSSVGIVEATVRGSGYMAVFTAGKTSWHSEGLEKLAKTMPAILAMQKTGKPSISIRKAG